MSPDIAVWTDDHPFWRETIKQWLTADRKQLAILQPCVDDWLPADHRARYVVERLDPRPILSSYQPHGRGSDPYHPAILLALLYCGFATGVMSSRRIERATHESGAFRFVAGGHHPDH